MLEQLEGKRSEMLFSHIKSMAAVDTLCRLLGVARADRACVRFSYSQRSGHGRLFLLGLNCSNCSHSGHLYWYGLHHDSNFVKMKIEVATDDK